MEPLYGCDLKGCAPESVAELLRLCLNQGLQLEQILWRDPHQEIRDSLFKTWSKRNSGWAQSGLSEGSGPRSWLARESSCVASSPGSARHRAGYRTGDRSSATPSTRHAVCKQFPASRWLRCSPPEPHGFGSQNRLSHEPCLLVRARYSERPPQTPAAAYASPRQAMATGVRRESSTAFCSAAIAGSQVDLAT